MDIENIKERLARVGLPLHGTDEQLFARAISNGLLLGITAQEVKDAPIVEELEPFTTKNNEDEANKTSEPRRGRPKKGK